MLVPFAHCTLNSPSSYRNFIKVIKAFSSGYTSIQHTHIAMELSLFRRIIAFFPLCFHPRLPSLFPPQHTLNVMCLLMEILMIHHLPYKVHYFLPASILCIILIILYYVSRTDFASKKAKVLNNFNINFNLSFRKWKVSKIYWQ